MASWQKYEIKVYKSGPPTWVITFPDGKVITGSPSEIIAALLMYEYRGGVGATIAEAAANKIKLYSPTVDTRP